MKKRKKIIATLLGVLFLALTPIGVKAQQPLDTKKNVSLTVNCTHETKPIEGIEFQLYHIADTDANTKLTLTKDFAKYPINLTDTSNDEWQTLGLTLSGYAQRDKIAPLGTGKTDANGVVKFPGTGVSMKPGLYMVTGTAAMVEGNIYRPKPIMVFLPSSEGNNWKYDAYVKAKYEFVTEPNPKPININVIKIWDDKGYEDARPEEIQVDLLKDGNVAETVTLNEENGWKYTWKNLSQASQWTVVEKGLTGYTVKVDKEGNTFTITNTPTGNPPPENPPGTPPTGTPPTGKPPMVPQTGQLWWPIPVLAVCGLILMTIGAVRKRKNNG